MTSPNNQLDGLAQNFLTSWREAHGLSASSASFLIGPDHLAILLEGAFSQAERKLAEAQSGENLLREYATELLNHICATMIERIQRAVKREVTASDVNVTPDTGQVLFIFKLGKENGRI